MIPYCHHEEYEAIEKLGEGGFGSVYKVINVRTRRIYAMKTTTALNKENLDSISQSFYRDVRALHMMNDTFVTPNIYCFNNEGPRYYFIMDYIPGKSLKHVPNTLVNVRNALSKLAMSINELHQRGLIWLDVKMDNIIYYEGNIKIVDFGFSVTKDDGPSIIGGTVMYLSPEHLKYFRMDRKKLMPTSVFDESSDWFSYGVIFYILNGRLLNNGKRYYPYEVIDETSIEPLYTKDEDYIKVYRWIQTKPEGYDNDAWNLSRIFLFQDKRIRFGSKLVPYNIYDLLNHPYFKLRNKY
ncbi:kinase-like protein [Rozella allomycis CSF55]|uniref:Kinase-like protein n=1 Tax=Rozella allomycis (strain CSF55) TaxID=988480 RepID=A0A4P9YPT3_ROZAC|nr:kinase-like protein [Rozella allomycis CSF55]